MPIQISISGSLSLEEFQRLRGLPATAKPRRRMPRVVRAVRPAMTIARVPYERMMRTLTLREPEAGGVLLGPMGQQLVTSFVPDETGQSTPTSFTFDHARLNDILRQFLKLDYEAKGFAHSHPSGVKRLSGGDLRFVQNLLLNPKNDADEVLMPIVVDGELIPYLIRRDAPDRPVPADVVIIN